LAKKAVYAADIITETLPERCHSCPQLLKACAAEPSTVGDFTILYHDGFNNLTNSGTVFSLYTASGEQQLFNN
jgi:hypothetical protein